MRCGGCYAVCPPDATISFDEHFYPRVDSKVCTECGLCLRVCPADDVDLPALYREVHGRGVAPDIDKLGPYARVYLAYSANREIRYGGSSGGFVTQFLVDMLENGEVDRVVVVSNKNMPLEPEPLLTDSPEVVIGSRGSKYSVVPVNGALRKIKQVEGKVAFVGLPCNIQSLRMWESAVPGLRDKIAVVVGLFCHNTLEREAGRFLLKKNRLKPDDVSGFEFRGGRWPGKVTAETRDKKKLPLHKHPYKDAFNALSKAYCPPPCRNCVDFCSELADVSVGDPWLRGPDGALLYPDARSLVVARTENGVKNIEKSSQCGRTSYDEIQGSLFEKNFSQASRKKKRYALWRLSHAKNAPGTRPRNHLKTPHFGTVEKASFMFKAAVESVLRTRPFKSAYLNFAFSPLGRLNAGIKETVKKNLYSLRSPGQTNPPGARDSQGKRSSL